MCTTTIRMLTLDSLLNDPLVQLVMRSDRVSEQDHSELLRHVQDCLVARTAMPQQPAMHAAG